MSLEEVAGPDPTRYAYKPSVMGAPAEFQLLDGTLEWRSGARSLRIAYADVTSIRMMFRPVTLQSFRFVTEVRSKSGLKLTIASTSWQSMVAHERHDAAYKAFIIELHRRVADANAMVTYRAGSPAFLFWPGAVILAGMLIGTAALAVRATGVGEWQGAAFVVAMLALFSWQAVSFLRRNIPGDYTPEKLPAQVLP
jgi:hypothetical protein